MSDTPNIVIVDEAVFVSRPGKLPDDALVRSQEARRHRDYLFERQRHRDWKDGRPEDPELAFWNETPS